MTDVGDFRRQFEQELAQAEQPETTFRDLLGQSSVPAESVAVRAGAETAAVVEEDDLADALAAVRDPDTDPDLLSSALHVITINIDRRPELFDALVATLRDVNLSSEVRLGVLGALHQLSFRMVQFPAKRPDYLATLRAMVDEPDVTLRRRVIGILAREKDEYVQRRLLDGLGRRSKALVPPAKAIQFLGYDVHAEYFPVLRRIVQDPPSRAAKREAVRLLAADPSSADMLASILADKTERPDVRRASAVALQALSPERFEEQARRIALDESEDDQLRALSITALSYFGTTASTDDELARGVEQLQSESTSRQVKQATEVFMAQRRA